MTSKSQCKLYLLFKENLQYFKSFYPDEKKSTVHKCCNYFLDYLENCPRKLETLEPDQLTVRLMDWKSHFYSTATHIKRATRQDCVSKVFRCIRQLCDSDQLPYFEIPVARLGNNKTSIQIKKRHLPESIGLRGERSRVEEDTIYIFKCPTNVKGKFSSTQNLQYLQSLALGPTISITFKEYQAGYAYATQARACSVFKQYFFFLFEEESLSDEKLSDQDFMQRSTDRFVRHIIDERSIQLISVNDRIKKLRSIYTHMSRKKVFPKIRFPDHVVGVDRFSQKLKVKTRILSMAIRHLERKDSSGALMESAFSKSNALDEEFLEALEDDERFAFNEIRQVAKEIVREKISRFRKGQKLIPKGEINAMRSTLERTGQLIDLTKWGKTGSQNLSFFSKSNSEGFANLLSYIWHEHSGLAFTRTFPGSYWIVDYGSEYVRDHLGLHSKNALAFFLIILGETGVNVTSLENAKIEDENGKTIILIPDENENYVHFNVEKPRARRTLSKLLPKDNSNLLKADSDSIEINAFTCLEAVVEMTARYRRNNQCKDLWIGPSKITTPLEPQLISSTPFKEQLRTLVLEHPRLKGFDPEYVTRANIRISAGLIKWFETGGDIWQVSQLLGNKPSTAINNYVPRELTELLYRREMRRYQRLLIVAASRFSPETLAMSLPELSSGEFTKLIHGDGRDNDIHQTDLFKYLFSGSSEKQNNLKTESTVIVLSPLNIALSKLIASSIEEFKLSQPSEYSQNKQFGGQTLAYWIELWAMICLSIRKNPDRSYKLAFRQGISLAEKLSEENSLDGLLGATHV